MLLRRLLFVAGILLILVVGLMLSEIGAEPVLLPDQNQPNTGTQNAAANQRTENPGQKNPERQELQRNPSQVGKSAGLEMGIPAFRGTIVRPDGSPAQNSSLETWATAGWALVLDRTLQESPGTIQQRFSCSSDGNFAVAEASRDGLRYILRFTAPDCAPLVLENLLATPGRTKELGTLQLQVGCSLKGLVFDPEGRPLTGVSVQVVPEPNVRAFTADAPEAWPALPGRDIVTDAAGRFSLTHLPVGAFHLRVQHAGWLAARSASQRGLDGEILPDATIRLLASHPLRGQVLDQLSRPIVQAKVLLQAKGLPDFSTTSNDNGFFSLDVPESMRQPVLRVAAAGFLATQTQVADRNHPLAIVLTPSPSLLGKVTDATSAPVQGAEIRLVLLRDSRNLGDGLPDALPYQGSVQSNADGSFELSPDWSATWLRKFRVVAWADSYLPSWSSSFLISEKTPTFPNEFSLVLQPGAIVRGRVLGVDGLPQEGARVLLRRLGTSRPGRRNPSAITMQRGTIQARTTTTSDGNFMFPSLPHADFQLMACADQLSPALGQEFVLNPNGHEEVLQLLASGGIRGQVLGDRSSFQRLKVTAITPGLDPLDTWVDDQGGFSLRHLLPAEYEIMLRPVDTAHAGSEFSFGNGFGLARSSGIHVRAGGFTEVSLHLQTQSLAEVHGQVLQNGKPAAGLRIFLVPQDLSLAHTPLLGWRSMVQRMRSTTTNSQGQYRLGGVDPDDFWLVVDRAALWPQGWGSLVGPGQEENVPQGLATRVLSLRPGDQVTVNFQVQLGTTENTKTSLEE